jgi:hypothetical protein
VSQKQVRNDLKEAQVSTDYSPETVTGQDGKAYPATPPEREPGEDPVAPKLSSVSRPEARAAGAQRTHSRS